MKVVFIKKYQKYNINDIGEFNDGFAKNFLINKKYAIAYNNTTSKIQQQNVLVKEAEEKNKLVQMKLFKSQIENLKLVFSAKGNEKQLFESITRKKIKQKLLNMGINISSNQIENIKINSFGNFEVKIMIDKKTKANLKIKINLHE